MSSKRIGGNPRDNGLYLEKFDTQEQAEEYIHRLGKRYIYSPNQKEMSLRKLIEDSAKIGIVVHRPALARWFKELGYIKQSVKYNRDRNRTAQTYTLSDELIEQLNDQPNKSYMVELGTRIVLGMPIEDVVLFLPTEDDAPAKIVIFKKEANGKIKAQTSGTINATDKQHIRTVLDLSNQKGMGVVVDYAKTFNFKFIGGNY